MPHCGAFGTTGVPLRGRYYYVNNPGDGLKIRVSVNQFLPLGTNDFKDLAEKLFLSDNRGLA